MKNILNTIVLHMIIICHIIINKCNNHYKQIIKYIMYTNKYNFIGIVKTYNNNKINNKKITMSNNNIRYKLLYVLYYKYNYYYYILNSKQHKTNILIININIIKNYFLLYIIFVYEPKIIYYILSLYINKII